MQAGRGVQNDSDVQRGTCSMAHSCCRIATADACFGASFALAAAADGVRAPPSCVAADGCGGAAGCQGRAVASRSLQPSLSPYFCSSTARARAPPSAWLGRGSASSAAAAAASCCTCSQF